jgi:hypothetical protein
MPRLASFVAMALLLSSCLEENANAPLSLAHDVSDGEQSDGSVVPAAGPSNTPAAGSADASTNASVIAPGGGCTTLADCPPGIECATEIESQLPGGACIQSCDPAKPAAAGLTCSQVPSGGIIQRICTASSPCRPGYGCIINTMTKIGTCEVSCAHDSHCPTTGHCDLYSGFCRAGVAGTGLNESCTRDEQCKSGRCMPTGGAIPGFCASDCVVSDPACPEDGVCIRISNDPAYTLGLCVKPCTDSACSAGFTCNAKKHCIPSE